MKLGIIKLIAHSGSCDGVKLQVLLTIKKSCCFWYATRSFCVRYQRANLKFLVWDMTRGGHFAPFLLLEKLTTGRNGLIYVRKSSLWVVTIGTCVKILKL